MAHYMRFSSRIQSVNSLLVFISFKLRENDKWLVVFSNAILTLPLSMLISIELCLTVHVETGWQVSNVPAFSKQISFHAHISDETTQYYELFSYPAASNCGTTSGTQGRKRHQIISSTIEIVDRKIADEFPSMTQESFFLARTKIVLDRHKYSFIK